MRRFVPALIAVLFANSVFAEAAPPATQPDDVPVKSVVLFSSGVGYFEHFGTVNGDASTQLNFKTNQINDILKSLILEDLDGGTVGGVTYPSQDPVEKTLRSFQVNITDNPPLADLLNQLRGASLTVSYASEKLTGTVLGVETKQRVMGDNKTPVPVAVLNLLTGASIRSVPLDDVQDIQLNDPKLQDELNRALMALAQSRDQEKKPVTISFRGNGARRVRLGYVVETPIWKTSYRLILDSDKPKLQGWAIVENQTDNDWNNVELSLVSGRPISFVEDLYMPLYVPRPVVEPELFASLRPQSYEGGMATRSLVGGNAPPGAVAYGAAENAMAKAELGQQLAQHARSLQQMQADTAEPANAPMDAVSSVRSMASTSNLGDLFQYTIGSVTLPRQKSAMLPIVNDPVGIERVSIYNQSVLPRNPLNGARLKNTTGKDLLQGPITVLDGGGYAGDAQIDDVPPGQDRLLSYGVDLQLLIDATKNSSTDAIQTGKIVKGVLYVTHKYVSEQDYIADNKSDKDKALIVEHPRRSDWSLVDSPKPAEMTDALYRFQQSVPAGKQSTLVVKEQMVQDETIEILPYDITQLAVYQRTGEIPQNVRDALAKAIDLRNKISDTQGQIQDHEQQLQGLTTDQGRIREDMRATDRQSSYYNRLLKKLDDQETTIEKLQTERDALTQQLADQQKALADYLSDLNVG
jgi:hypothetical protein